LLTGFATICRMPVLVFEISSIFVIPAKLWRVLSRL
jgi:hypothetical protein